MREQEVTRGRRIDNFKKEVPSKVLLYLGYSAALCLLILCIFFGLRSLLGFKGPIFGDGYEIGRPISRLEDKTIDIDGLLEGSTISELKKADPDNGSSPTQSPGNAPAGNGSSPTQSPGNAPAGNDSNPAGNGSSPTQSPGNAPAGNDS
ncbi:uncharacterized protein METZ01_LOCUS392492, partial [marine metagenome]